MNFKSLPRPIAILLSAPAALAIGAVMSARTIFSLIFATFDLMLRFARGQHVDVAALYAWYLNVSNDPTISRIRPKVIMVDESKVEQ